MKAELVILGGSVITMDPSLPKAQAVAVKSGRIMAVGKVNHIRNLIGSETLVLRANGKTIVPGFIDCHVHFIQTGLDLSKIDLRFCKNVNEVKKLIVEQVDKVKPGQWIMGASYQDFAFTEKRPPTRQELDQVAPKNPVWLSRLDTHSGVLNSEGLQKLQLPEDVEGLETNENGEPNGLVKGEANNYVRSSINKSLDKETRREALINASHKMLSAGVTTVHACEGGVLSSEDDAEFILNESENVPLDIRLLFQTTNINKILQAGLPRIGGDILIDGSFGSKTAALRQPYNDDTSENGILYFTQKELDDFVQEAHCKGLQVSVHAIGDAAIEQILTAYERAQAEEYRDDHRHRIEHFSLPAPSHINRSIKLGVVHSLQTSWFWSDEEVLLEKTLDTRLGCERSNLAYPLGSIWLAGGRICGSSDAPIVPADPLAGIYGTVKHFRTEERLSKMAGLSFYTTGAAYSSFEENEKGKIAPGFLADIVVLGGDFLSESTESLLSMGIEATIIRGEVKYAKNNKYYRSS